MHNALFFTIFSGENTSSVLDIGAHGIRGVVNILMIAVIGFVTLLAFFGFGAQIETALPAPSTNSSLGAAWSHVLGGFNSLFQISPTLLILGIFIAVVGFLALAGRIGWSWF